MDKKKGARKRPGATTGGRIVRETARRPPPVVSEADAKLIAHAFVAQLNAVAQSAEDKTLDIMREIRAQAFASAQDALDDERHANAIWRELKAKAGQELRMSGDTLSVLLRVDAFDELMRENGKDRDWKELTAQHRIKLLPLGNLDQIEKLAAQVAEQKIGPLATAALVRSTLKGLGRKIGGRRITARGIAQVIGASKIKFVEPESQRRVVEVVKKLPADRQEAVVGDLREIARNIEAILADLER